MAKVLLIADWDDGQGGRYSAGDVVAVARGAVVRRSGPTGSFTLGPVDLQLDLGVKTLFGDEILIMLVVPPVLAGLAWFLLRTDVGVAVRAAAENEDRALLLGIPIRRLSTIVWMIAGGLLLGQRGRHALRQQPVELHSQRRPQQRNEQPE